MNPKTSRAMFAGVLFAGGALLALLLAAALYQNTSHSQTTPARPQPIAQADTPHWGKNYAQLPLGSEETADRLRVR